jgi:amidase
MARSVSDAAITFAVLANRPSPGLDREALRAARIGVWRPPVARTAAISTNAVAALTQAGAECVEIDFDTSPLLDDELPAMIAEFRDALDRYLASAPDAATRTMAELVAFNRADPIELSVFGQEILEQALAAPPLSDATYLAQRARASGTARALIDDPITTHRLDAIITLAADPAWLTDYAHGDEPGFAGYSAAAIAGYPSVTVPAGFVDGLPVGVLFFAGAHTDSRLLDLAYAFEQATLARRSPPHW